MFTSDHAVRSALASMTGHPADMLKKDQTLDFLKVRSASVLGQLGQLLRIKTKKTVEVLPADTVGDLISRLDAAQPDPV